MGKVFVRFVWVFVIGIGSTRSLWFCYGVVAMVVYVVISLVQLLWYIFGDTFHLCLYSERVQSSLELEFVKS